MRSAFVVVAALLLGLSLGGCGLSRADFNEIVEEARACQPGDTCVLAGASSCTCPQPVNATEKERVDQAADDLYCRGGMVDCIPFSNLRCEQGLCTGDTY